MKNTEKVRLFGYRITLRSKTTGHEYLVYPNGKTGMKFETRATMERHLKEKLELLKAVNPDTIVAIEKYGLMW